jgi:hypothetical protein
VRASFRYFDQPRLLSLERSHRLGGSVGRALGALRGASAEAVAELAGDELECAHAAGTGGLSSLGLLTPVVCFGSCQMCVLMYQGRMCGVFGCGVMMC